MLAELAHPAAVVLAGAREPRPAQIVADVLAAGAPVGGERAVGAGAPFWQARLDWFDAAEAARPGRAMAMRRRRPGAPCLYQEAFGAFRTAYANNATLFGAGGWSRRRFGDRRRGGHTVQIFTVTLNPGLIAR